MIRKPDVRFSDFSKSVRLINLRLINLRLSGYRPITGQICPDFRRPVPIYIQLQTGRYINRTFENRTILSGYRTFGQLYRQTGSEPVPNRF